ncbi:MAG: TlpA disulfide reductase family protein [Luteolibacter sp.]
MKPWLHTLPAIAACIWLAPSAHAALKSGDPAPKIKVSAWAQGEEVKEFEGDKVYIVEFWATWCGPCIASIPHVNELQKKYQDKGLVVIGQNLGEDSKKVSDFVKQMSGKMGYRVTVDDKSEGGWMAKNWLTAAGQNGIPCAFVVNKKGNIAYIGHPMELKESLIESLLAEASTKAPGAQAPAAEAKAPSEKAIVLSTRAQSEIRAGKFDEAESTIGQLQEALTPKFGYVGGLLELDLLLAKKQPDDAIELSKILCEDYAKQPGVISLIAAHLVAPQDAGVSLRNAAEKLATPLAANAAPGQASALATLSRIADLNGDKARAAELKAKADAAQATERDAVWEAVREARLLAVP